MKTLSWYRTPASEYIAVEAPHWPGRKWLSTLFRAHMLQQPGDFDSAGEVEVNGAFLADCEPVEGSEVPFPIRLILSA